MPWLANPWLVNSVTGLLSGLGVFVVTRWLDSGKRRREIQERARQVIEELVREVMASAFLSGEAKQDHVARLVHGFVAEEVQPEPEDRSGSASAFVRLALSAGATLLGVFASDQLGISFKLTSFLSWSLLVIGVVAATVVLAAIVFVLVSNLSKPESTSASQDQTIVVPEEKPNFPTIKP